MKGYASLSIDSVIMWWTFVQCRILLQFKDEMIKLLMRNVEFLKARQQRLAKIGREEMETWKAVAFSNVEPSEDRKKVTISLTT